MFFSVIVPIYNVEEYLKECIESVLNQTFADFELILVDDGSKDNCPDICNNYQNIDSRIKVIHKKNGGLVSARQAGLIAAKGNYVVNLDGDDYLIGDMLEKAYKIIAKTDADMVSFSHLIRFSGGIFEKDDEPIAEGLYKKNEIEKYIYPKILLDENMNHMHYFLWGKAIKRALIMQPQLSVNKNITLGEDLCCIVPCYLSAEKIYISKESSCVYNVRENSISKAAYTNQLKKIEDVMNVLYKFNSNAISDFAEQISRYYCYMCFAVIAATAEQTYAVNVKEIKYIILHSPYIGELKNSKFKNITVKSRIAVWLIKKGLVAGAFYFLRLCGFLKNIIRK